MKKIIFIFRQKEIRIVLFISTLVIIFARCEEKFSFKPKANSKNDFVISGAIHQGPGPYFISVARIIKKSTDFSAVKNAQVIIIDDGGNEEDCAEVNPGIYRCEGLLVKGVPGRSYHVEINIMGSGLYRSFPDLMPMIKGGDLDVEWEEKTRTTTSTNGIDVRSQVVQLSLTAQLPQTNEQYYMYWTTEELYQLLHMMVTPFGIFPLPCYIIKNVGDRVDLFDSKNFVSSRIFMEDFRHRKIDVSFRLKHIFSTYQFVVSEEYHSYLLQLEELTEKVGSIFDTPKGIAKGNIISISNPDENVHGFFRAVQADTINFVIFPNDLSRVPLDPCALDPGQSCFECPLNSGDHSTRYNKTN